MPFRDRDAKRAYNRRYQREVWYPANRALHGRRVRACDRRRVERNVAEIIELKRRPCADCGVVFPPECMDFDHREGTKLADVSTLVHSIKAGQAVVRAEIAKCEIVCANCHRIRTAARRRAVPA